LSSKLRFQVEDRPPNVLLVLDADATFPSAQFGIDRLTIPARIALDSIAATLQQEVGRSLSTIEVVGHTDTVPTGRAQWTNTHLSAARAATVVEYLGTRQLSPCILSASGRGSYFPTRPGNDTASLRANRRIELLLHPVVGASLAAVSGACKDTAIAPVRRE
jgi:chemotaxis protein MotB